VLVTIDTLRADHLQSHGYPRQTSPRIAALAESGVLFEQARSQAPWTLPSMASLHTSLHPSAHGATGARTRLPERILTLAEVLRAEGYDTIAVVSHWFVGRRVGLSQGFDVFDESNSRGHAATTSPDLTHSALAHFAARTGDAPVFLWVHYFDPHSPYLRHPEYGFADASDSLGDAVGPAALDAAAAEGGPLAAAARDHARNLYDEEIAFTDRFVGVLADGIRALAGDRPLVIALTGDHGEAFLERGRFGHGVDVYEELVHVPLLLTGDIPPPLRGLRVAAPVEVASLAPTLARLGGAEPPFAGLDLIAVAGGEAVAAPVYLEGGWAWGDDRRRNAVVADGWKLIHDVDADRYELYDLAADPEERDDRFEQEARSLRCEHLLDLLRAYEDRAPASAPKIELSAEERERLRLLGYAER
jgi:arylsulfatase A-like enzyme